MSETGIDFEMLVSAVDKDPVKLAERMNIRSDALIINQLRYSNKPRTALPDTGNGNSGPASADAGNGRQETGSPEAGNAEPEPLPCYMEFIRTEPEESGTGPIGTNATDTKNIGRSSIDINPISGTIRVFNLHEKGVGLSRNNALMRAKGEICLFCDDDIIYEDNLRELVLGEFGAHPEADMLLFNVDVKEDRWTYHNDSYGRVNLLNCGRYPAYSFAIKRDVMHKKNLVFSLLFGGGAKYSNGEDSLFISDCIKRGVRVYKTPVKIGREESEGSTWFYGYNEKFFRDRGVLYHYLYGPLAVPLSLRFLLAHRGKMCREISWPKAFKIMRKGITSQKQ